MNEFKNDNSKKLIIGISILFCTVILIVGGTLAFFTQSDTKTIGNVVSTNNVTLHYDDNDDFMLGDLIPTSEEYAIRGYEREENKCKDDNGYNICSVYRFTITNTADVSQDLIIDMTPTLNTFTNLKVMLYEVNGNNKTKKGNTYNLKLNNKSTVNLENNLTLTPNESKTYELVYYILNLENIDQTQMDAGKNFGATISVNSVTTGYHLSNQEGATCWVTEPVEKGSSDYKLTEFLGIDNSNTDIDYLKITPGCEEYVTIDESDNTFIVNIPNTYGNANITALGNPLFSGIIVKQNEEGEFVLTFNNYYKIKEFNIAEEITIIEDVGEDDEVSLFYGLGYNFLNDEVYVENVIVNLPSTLTYIGNSAFEGSQMKNIDFPSNLETIGEYAFDGCNLLSLSIPYSVTTIGEAAFRGNENLKYLTFEGSLTDRIESGDNKNLLIIGQYAFKQHNLSYLGTNDNDWLKLPARIEYIGESAFAGDTGKSDSLRFIRYMGNRDILNTFGTNWYEDGVTVKAYGEE